MSNKYVPQGKKNIANGSGHCKPKYTNVAKKIHSALEHWYNSCNANELNMEIKLVDYIQSGANKKVRQNKLPPSKTMTSKEVPVPLSDYFITIEGEDQD